MIIPCRLARPSRTVDSHQSRFAGIPLPASSRVSLLFSIHPEGRPHTSISGDLGTSIASGPAVSSSRNSEDLIECLSKSVVQVRRNGNHGYHKETARRGEGRIWRSVEYASMVARGDSPNFEIKVCNSSREIFMRRNSTETERAGLERVLNFVPHSGKP